jgi:hypothetical protein
MRLLLALCALLAAGSAVRADDFTTSLGGPSKGAVLERRQGTTGSVAVPIDELNPMPTATTSGSLTIVPLDVATVTTGGTAVTALAAGHRNKGGFLLNPSAATVDLCINEQATAAGTVSAGALLCISAGQTYTLSPSALGVSVVTSDSAHPFAGQGYN